MKSPLGTLVRIARPTDKAPVPYVGRSQVSIPWAQPSGMQQQLRAMSTVGTLFAIVDKLAGGCAQAEWKLYRTARPGTPLEEREEVTSHAALDLWANPNPFFTQQEFVETIQQHHELTGEQWWVASWGSSRSLGPQELWPVRPDRMDPVPHPTEFLSGYLYRGPEGEQIPLRLNEVIFVRRPHPTDPYRGISPIVTLLADLEGSKLSAEWNRNFFLNSAEPGGIIEMPDRLEDDEFDELAARWKDQHQGVANAHRVAIIEQGKWIERKYTNRDMQFVELRAASSEIIREAYGFPKPLLGTVEDVNRANADAAEVVFAKWLIKPRLERIKQALNHDLLPMFGATGKGVEFDYINAVPDDREADDRERESRAKAWEIYVRNGADPESAAEAMGVPPMEYAEPEPAPPALVPAPDQPAAIAPAARVEIDVRQHAPAALASAPVGALARPAARPSFLALAAATRPRAQETAQDGTELPTIEHVQTSWDQALTALLAEWAGVVRNQIIALVAKIREIARTGKIQELATINAPTSQAEDILKQALVALAELAAGQVVQEAADQGATVPPGQVDQAVIGQIAILTAAGLADELTLSARREAQRVWRPGVPVGELIDAVLRHLEGLTDARPRQYLGGALTQAQHEGRAATFQAAEDAAGSPPKPGEPERAVPTPAYYGQEILDANTCRYCREIDGRWLGNTLAEARRDYPMGGYTRCEGRERCRGMVVAVWRGGSDPSKWIEKEPVG